MFQDYNKEVLVYHTFLNYLQNQGQIHESTRLELISADWNDLKDSKFFNGYEINECQFLTSDTVNIQKRQFDCIFGADILYEVENYQTLLEMFDNLLTDRGCVFIITKMYYFGNGGGLYEFQDHVDSSKLFKHRSLQVINDNSSNRREIILLERI